MTGGQAAPAAPAGALSRWDPRFRIVALLLLAFAVSSVTRLHLLPLVAALTASLVVLSGTSPKELARRLRYPSLVVLALVALLPFLSGATPVAGIGPLTITAEGLEAALLVAVRSCAIMTLAAVLLGAAPLLVNIRALRALGVPDIMADMALLAIRHIELQAQEMRRMRIAMRLRGHDARRFSPRNLRMLSWLAGSLLLRGHERSERVYQAMRLRGYGSAARPPDAFRASHRDLAGLAAAALAAALLVWLELMQ